MDKQSKANKHLQLTCKKSLVSTQMIYTSLEKKQEDVDKRLQLHQWWAAHRDLELWDDKKEPTSKLGKLYFPEKQYVIMAGPYQKILCSSVPVFVSIPCLSGPFHLILFLKQV